MARLFSRLAASAAIAAALSMAATPAAAARLPSSAPAKHGWTAPSGSGDALAWRGRRHHDDGIDAGDVLTGILVLGGIAAIASAASQPKREPVDYGYRDEDDRYSERYPDERPDYRDSRSSWGSGIDNAVDMCVDQVERGESRVASVDNAARTNDGWRVSGQLGAGGDFSCWIDNDGRIRSVDLDQDPYYGASSDDDGGYREDNQWDDDTYARARAQAGTPEPYGDPYDDSYDDYSGDYSEIDGDIGG